MSDNEVALTVARTTGKMISEKEIAYMSSAFTLSDLFNYHDLSQIQNFQWSKVWADLTSTAPILVTALESLMPKEKKRCHGALHVPNSGHDSKSQK